MINMYFKQQTPPTMPETNPIVLLLTDTAPTSPLFEIEVPAPPTVPILNLGPNF